MFETVKVPIKMEYERALASKADVDFILKQCGGTPLNWGDLRPGDTVVLNYELAAQYLGRLPETLSRVKRLADENGARALGEVRMFLLEVLRALEGL